MTLNSLWDEQFCIPTVKAYGFVFETTYVSKTNSKMEDLPPFMKIHGIKDFFGDLDSFTHYFPSLLAP